MSFSRASVKTKTIVALLFAGVLASTAVISAFYAVRVRNEFARLEQGLNRSAESIAPAISESLWNLSFDMMNLQMTGALAPGLVQAVTVRTLSGDVYEKRRASFGGVRYVEIPLNRLVDGHSWGLGTLRLEASEDEAISIARDGFFSVLAMVSAIVGALMFAAYHIIGWIFVRPLNRISQDFSLSPHEWLEKHGVADLPLPMVSDEWTKLQDAMNGMRRRWRSLLDERSRVEAELRVAKDAAEQAGRAKSLFLANMSHEVRTPLQGIMGGCSLLKQSSLSPQQFEFLRFIDLSSVHLSEYLTGVLEAASLEHKDVALKPVVFDVKAELASCIQMTRELANQKGLELSVDCQVLSEELVYADAVRFRQVLLNIMGNAVKFTQEGAVNVRLVKSLPKVDGKVFVDVSVSDTGIGISPESHTRIFEFFTQEGACKFHPRQGVGLGLAISKRIVSAMGGTIRVESDIGRGACFIVSLPMQIAKEQV